MNLEEESHESCFLEMGESSSAVRSKEMSCKGRAEPEGLVDLQELSDEAIDTEDESVDLSFAIDVSIKSDSGHVADIICEEWVTGLDWGDRASLGLFLRNLFWERKRQKQQS